MMSSATREKLGVTEGLEPSHCIAADLRSMTFKVGLGGLVLTVKRSNVKEHTGVLSDGCLGFLSFSVERSNSGVEDFHGGRDGGFVGRRKRVVNHGVDARKGNFRRLIPHKSMMEFFRIREGWIGSELLLGDISGTMKRGKPTLPVWLGGGGDAHEIFNRGLCVSNSLASGCGRLDGFDELAGRKR